MTEEKKLTLGSLFDGSGGFSLGAILAGIEPRWASEVEPFPIRVTTKRLPMVKHYGDINQIHGGKVEPVDIITFGSPCTDMSIAGKRAGLDGKQSCLFYEAVRLIKEMREATNGRYPRYIVWENVTGAFSSSGGRDFQSVLTEIVRIKKPQAPQVPMPEKAGWPYADILMGDGWSLAYRVMDAQGWGVPQRRRRIYLVADFAGGSAPKVLFDTESLFGDSAPCFGSWQGFAGKLEAGPGTAGWAVGFDGYNSVLTGEKAATIGVNCGMSSGRNGVLQTGGFCTEPSAKSRGIGYEEEKSPTIRAGGVPAAITVLNDQGGQRMDVTEGITNTLRAESHHPPLVYENHSMDARYKGPLEVAPTVSSTYGTGGNNQPLVSTIDIRLTSEGTRNARHNIHETHISRCIDTSGNVPDANQGGVAIVQPDTAYAMTTGSYTQVEKEKSPTLMSRDFKDPNAVCCGIGRDVFNAGANAKFAPSIDEELQPPMMARDPGAVSQGYIVRRLTPLECCRLQGFPDWWCADLGTDNPTENEMAFWRDVFETHRKIVGKAKKPKSDNQIRKWLADPHTDGAEYKMWGNGVALPCVYYVMMGIAHFSKEP